MKRVLLFMVFGSSLLGGVVGSYYFFKAKSTIRNTTNEVPDQQVIDQFLAYRGIDAAAPTKQETIKNKNDCAPCAAKAAALKAGGVPSKPRESKTDPPFQRITGRTQDFVLPLMRGGTTIQVPKKIDAWVSLSHGMPFEQIRCRIILSDTGLVILSLSGITAQERQIEMNWQTDPAPQLETWGPLIKTAAHDIWQTLKAVPEAINSEQNYGRYRAQAVSAEQIFFVSATPTQLYCDDLDIHMSEQGRPIRITHIQATYADDKLNATRQIWLINYQ